MSAPPVQTAVPPWRRLVLGGALVVGLVVLFFLLFPGAAPSRGGALREEELEAPYESLKSLHAPKRAPQPGDWLAENPESGQALKTYKALADSNVGPRPGQRTIYLQRLGRFTPAQERIVTLTAEYVELFFGLPVALPEPLPSSVIPAEARRNNPMTGQPQLLTRHILFELLAPRRPADAVIVVAFTAEDLYPGPEWNFVFGEASMLDRVGVWSLARNGDPSQSDEAFRRCLRRTIGTAVHEIAHMFSLPHCIAYECVLNGSNSLEEADTQPLEPCPICLNKLCSNLGCDPVKRYQQLLAFTTREQLTQEAPALERALHQLQAPGP